MLNAPGPSTAFSQWANGMLAVLCFAGLAPGQTLAPKPDPLEWLFSDERPSDREFRLRVSLLRVPVQEAAEALLADAGDTAYFWRARLSEWRKEGKLEAVSVFGGDMRDMEEKSGLPPNPYRFIGQKAAARLWQELVETEEARLPPVDLTPLLQDLSEYPVGNNFKGIISIRPGLRQAQVKLQLGYCPPPEERPSANWPLPGLRAPRCLFQQWSLNVMTTCHVNEPFLLGSQMEPPKDGQADTGHVLMAFGRLVLPEDSGRDLQEEKPRIQPCRQIQTWTLAVNKELFLPWIAKRKSGDDDGETFKGWLQLAATKSGVEVAGSAAVALPPSGRGEVTSSLRWQDVYGFEPGGIGTHFTPSPCEEEIYHLQHSLTLDCVPVEGGLNRCSIELSRPAKAAQWQKWKTAMERDSQDPHAIEVAEADLHEQSQRLQSTFSLRPGEVTLAAAGMKGDKIYVNFARLTETAAAPVAAAPDRFGVELPAAEPSRTTTFWAAETPESWGHRLLAPKVDFNRLAQEVMEAAFAGKEATVTGLSAQTLDADSTGFHREMEPRIFFGDYLNTAPAPKGIFFNPRTVYQVHVGLQTRTEGGLVTPCSIDDIGEPEWRHWGIWQPAVKGTNEHNSGVIQPIFPTGSLSVAIRPNAAPWQVLGVLKIAGRTEPQPQPAKLRWYLLQSNAKAAADAPPEPVDDRLTTVQAIVLHLPSALLEESRTAAALLGEAAAGKIRVLDFITVAKYFEGGTDAAVGNNYYFTSGRRPRSGENWNELIFKAPSQMPAGTPYDDQIWLRNRLVGFTLNLHDKHWKIERDPTPPQIVTDTFDDARQEWPNLRRSREEMPKVTVCVQRPIFTIEEHAGDLPAAGECSMTPLSKDTVLIMRTLK